MTHLLRYLLLVPVLLPARPQAVAAGELQQVRQGVHTPRPLTLPPLPPRRERTTLASSTQDDESLTDWLLTGTLTAPYWLPYRCFDQPGYDRFAGYSGLDYPTGLKDSEWFYRSTAWVPSARGRVEYGTNFGDLQSVGGNLQVDLPLWRMTLDSSWTNYYEDLAGGGTDELALGDANLVFRFAQNSHLVWRSGAGINWLADSDSQVGFNFTYGFDILPREPFVWSTEFDWGRLGHSSLFRGRTTLGAQWRDGELYTGFEYVDIHNGHLPLLLLGVRYWW